MTDHDIVKLLHELEAEVESLKRLSSALNQLIAHEGKLDLLASELTTVSDEIIFLRRKLTPVKSRRDYQLDFKIKSLSNRLDRLEMERIAGSSTPESLEHKDRELARARDDLAINALALSTARDNLAARERELSRARIHLESRERELIEQKKRIQDLEAQVKKIRRRPWWRKIFPGRS
ncbi:MAG: hypothetical protein AB1611_09375 [bacterium]